MEEPDEPEEEDERVEAKEREKIRILAEWPVTGNLMTPSENMYNFPFDPYLKEGISTTG